MSQNDWRLKAHYMYFKQHMQIKDIAVEIKISRQTVAKYLKECEEFSNEKARRKKESENNKKLYQQEWYVERKQQGSYTDKDSLKQEHFEAVRVLSYEKFY